MVAAWFLTRWSQWMTMLWLPWGSVGRGAQHLHHGSRSGNCKTNLSLYGSGDRWWKFIASAFILAKFIPYAAPEKGHLVGADYTLILALFYHSLKHSLNHSSVTKDHIFLDVKRRRRSHLPPSISDRPTATAAMRKPNARDDHRHWPTTTRRWPRSYQILKE